MRNAVIYARVSSKEQEREGFSIPAQLKLLHEYARRNELEIVKEFVDIETAKMTGRKQFGEMRQFLSRNSSCRAVIVEKTDRLYRNFKDHIIIEELDVELHLVKEGQIISKDSKSQAKLVHGIQLVMARNYIENLREEVKKGMREKAEQGTYPSRPPLGYRNNKAERSIEIDPSKTLVAKRMFELYSSGKYSLTILRVNLKEEFGVDLAKGYLERLLKNPFYMGQFRWEGKIYQGNHPPLVSSERFYQTQDVFQGRNKPRYRTHDFPYRGLLVCAYDNCKVTAEIKKGKYIYYRCTQFRGKCGLPYIREEQLGDRLGEILRNIRIPDAVLDQLQESLYSDKNREAGIRAEQTHHQQQRLALIHRRMDQAYQDKLDSKISEEFWVRKSSEWQVEEQKIIGAIQSLKAAKPERLLDAARILELANKAYFLYVKQTDAEKAKLLKMVLSNCAIDAVNIYPSYKKPFDLIFNTMKNGKWCARGDSNSRPSGS